MDVINGTTYAITTKVSTGPVPGDLLVTPDGAYVVVNNSSGSSISVIDTQTPVATTISVNGAPRGNVAIPLQ